MLRLGVLILAWMRRVVARHRLIGRARRTVGFGRRIAETFGRGHVVAEAAQALVAQGGPRLLARRRLVSATIVRPHAPGRLRLDLADRFLQRQALVRDLGFLERGLDAAQLADQRAARALVQRTAILAGVLLEPGDSAGDQGVIVSHCNKSTQLRVLR